MALQSRSLHVKVNLDNTWDTRYPQGTKPQVQPSSLGIDLNAFNAANIILLGKSVNTPFTQNYRQFLTGTSAATATLTVNATSGVLGNWLIDGTGNSLTNNGTVAGTGQLQVVASDGAGNTASFPLQNWSYIVVNASRIKHPLGIIIYLDQNQMFGNNISVTLSRMDQLVALLGDNLVAFSIYPNWAQLEGPSLGQYDGSWSTDRQNRPKGFDLVDVMLAKCASYTKPRYLKVNNFIYLNGGQPAGSQSPTFKTNFQPAYMNDPAYGILDTSRGLIYGQWVNCYATSGRNEAAFPLWWTAPVMNRIRALDQGYGARYASHPLFMSFSSLSEFTVPITTSYPNASNELAMLQNLFLGSNGYFANARSSWPGTKVHMFFNFTSNPANQKILIDECAKYSISIGAPDIIYKNNAPSYSWDQRAYLGINPSTNQLDSNYVNYVNKLDYIAQWEPLDLDGTRGTVAQLWSVVRSLGACSLEIFDNRYSGPASTNQFPALATTVNQLMASQPLNQAYPALFQGA